MLSITKMFDYLSVGHEPTTIAILLGVAASHIGTMDASVSKVRRAACKSNTGSRGAARGLQLLSIHIPALQSAASTDLEVPLSVQTAAIVGIGLLFERSYQRHICEVRLAGSRVCVR